MFLPEAFDGRPLSDALLHKVHPLLGVLKLLLHGLHVGVVHLLDVLGEAGKAAAGVGLVGARGRGLEDHGRRPEVAFGRGRDVLHGDGDGLGAGGPAGARLEAVHRRPGMVTIKF